MKGSAVLCSVSGSRRAAGGELDDGALIKGDHRCVHARHLRDNQKYKQVPADDEAVVRHGRQLGQRRPTKQLQECLQFSFFKHQRGPQDPHELLNELESNSNGAHPNQKNGFVELDLCSAKSATEAINIRAEGHAEAEQPQVTMRILAEDSAEIEDKPSESAYFVEQISDGARNGSQAQISLQVEQGRLSGQEEGTEHQSIEEEAQYGPNDVWNERQRSRWAQEQHRRPCQELPRVEEVDQHPEVAASAATSK